MALTRPTVLPVWADAGDKTQPTDGEISIGWPVTNIPPSRQRFNWFFNWAANAVRYFSRRGVPDWIATETFEIGDIQRSLVNGKTYRSIVAANINFEPSANPLKWERWGFSLSELWAYITSGLYGGACPNTGPASAPTLANPYTKYKSALGEYWEWQGDAWKVVAGRVRQASTATTAITSGALTQVASFTCHRAGTVTVMGHANCTAIAASGEYMLSYLRLNTVNSIAATAFSTATSQFLTNSGSHTLQLAQGDVFDFVIQTNFNVNVKWGFVAAYVE